MKISLWMVISFLFLETGSALAQEEAALSMGKTISFLQTKFHENGKSGGSYSEITKVVVNPCVIYWKEVFHHYAEVDSIENYLPSAITIESISRAFDGKYVRYNIKRPRFIQIYYYQGERRIVQFSQFYLKNRDKSLPDRLKMAIEQLDVFCGNIEK